MTPEPAPFPTLATARLQLREITAADAADLFAIHSDAQHMRHFGCDPLDDIAGAHDLVRTFANWRSDANPGIRWALQARDQPNLLGTCGLFKWQRDWRKCSVGYELARHACGHGFMREALTAALAWGFAKMALNRIEAQIHPDNRASIELVRRLGFVEEGRLRECGYWLGRHHDLLQFSLLQRDWLLAL